MSAQDQLFPDPPIMIPSKAVSATQSDLLGPAQTLLHGLNLLGTKEETEQQGVITSPPPSVALIEASATSLGKAWATGLGASVVAVWGGIATWWLKQNQNVQVTVLWEAGIASASAIVAIGYILGSDLRGRSAAAVATIQARATIATALVTASESAAVLSVSTASSCPPPGGCCQPSPPAPNPMPTSSVITALTPPVQVEWIARPAADETGWQAVAMSSGASTVQFYLVKGPVQQWVNAGEVTFPPLEPADSGSGLGSSRGSSEGGEVTRTPTAPSDVSTSPANLPATPH